MSRYIDAEQLKHIVNEKKYNARNKHFFFDCIYECDTADVAPVVHAKWIKLRYKMYTCSRCKRSVYLEGLNVTEENETKLLRELYPYCNCGAKMNKE